MAEAFDEIVRETLPGGSTLAYRRLRSGTCYRADTPADVVNILEDARIKDYGIRVFYGDRETGRDWLDECDVIGYIGRSGGEIQIPLMIKNRRKCGGPALLDHCIVKIMRGEKVLYEDSRYHTGTLEVKPSDLPEYAAAVYVDGKLHARFKTVPKAEKFVAFLMGVGGNRIDNRVDEEDRADYAAVAVRKYLDAKEQTGEVTKNVVAALVADLRLFCDQMGIAFHDVVKKSGGGCELDETAAA